MYRKCKQLFSFPSLVSLNEPLVTPRTITLSREVAQEPFMIRTYRGHSPQIASSCYIDVSAQILGDVILGERSSVWMNAVLRGDVNSIRVGSATNVQDCSVLHGQRNRYPVIVGDWVTIGHNVTVHGCVVEDMCVIGMGARVLNNSRIGEGSIIAAGSVVPENTIVPPGTLWAGVPARHRREITDQDRDLIREYAQNYLDYVEIYRNEPPQEAGNRE
jgi:carbonic anhydrase/acetyltransferase-like protein (isoleucine patch superfamily)